MTPRISLLRYLTVLLLGLTWIAGCGRAPVAHFRSDLEGRKADDISISQREAIDGLMTDWFGTPDAPQVPELPDLFDEPPLDHALLQQAAGPGGLYRRHCAVCHGVSGDGAGPLATTFDPYPRDFRTSVLKYTSTIAGARATRDDLEGVIQKGLAATGMPGFVQLSDEQVRALAEYVKYLGIRGETEKLLASIVIDENEYLPLSNMTQQIVLEDGMGWAVEQWQAPERMPEEYLVSTTIFDEPLPTGAELEEAIARGRELYQSKDAQCVSCHGETGRGDGENTDLWDDWNKPKHGVSAAMTERLASQFRLPIQTLRPRDFRQGLFRGGTADVDLFRRIHAGTKGTPMPAAGESLGVPGIYSDQDIRDVILYIRSLSD